MDASTGKATQVFIRSPLQMQWWEFAGIAFIIFVLARHWSMFVNEFTR
jgi:hypothetical protein